MARLHWNHEKRVEGFGLEVPEGSPDADPRGSVCLPHFVEQLHHFIVDDEHDSHVRTDPAQSGNGALVESGVEWEKNPAEEVDEDTAPGQRVWVQTSEGQEQGPKGEDFRGEGLGQAGVLG